MATVHKAQAKIAGPAVTFSCQPGDNLRIHASIDVVAPGDVLVVTTAAESTEGMFVLRRRASLGMDVRSKSVLE